MSGNSSVRDKSLLRGYMGKESVKFVKNLEVDILYQLMDISQLIESLFISSLK